MILSYLHPSLEEDTVIEMKEIDSNPGNPLTYSPDRKVSVFENAWIIDDDEVNNFIYARLLEKSNQCLDVKVFTRAFDALGKIELLFKEAPNSLPDLILLDINMPEMNGWQFLEQLELLLPKFPKEITLYMVSSSLLPEDITRAQASTVVKDYCPKPVSAASLREMLTRD